MTLYEQFGGATAITDLLDGLYERATDDPLLRPFLENLDLERLKEQQFVFISHALDGPHKYSGRPLDVAHARLRIENRHFDAFVGHVRAVLGRRRASDDLAAKIISRVVAVRAVIVNAETAKA